MTESATTALPPGFALNEYRIESTLGVGGFGLTYLATDRNLDLKVAIKEFLPGEFALRGDDQSVRPKSDTTVNKFKWGLSRFVEESRTLASFRHPNIVRVMRFFEANQTAYMVMEFVAGQPLGEWVGARRPLPEQALLAIARPLLDGLEVIHRAKFLHRDIKPNNIFMRDDASPVLLDFGSARVSGTDSDMTAIITPGYAPFEQYHSHGNQGPWTDLYSFGAVMYWIVTGAKPVEAAARVRKDVMIPAVWSGDRSRYSMGLLEAIDWALAPTEEARPQSVADFRGVLQRLETASASEKPTVLVTGQRAADAGEGRTSGPTMAVFDRDAIKRIESELAAHIGPIAPMVIRSAARKTATLAQLAELVANEIADEQARAAFLKKFSGGEKSLPPGSQSRIPNTGPSAPPSHSAPQRFNPALLASAEATLAKYIGAVARVVVKRAAAKARDEAEFYLLLADQIEDKDERKAFVRKAMSVSGKT